MGPYRYHELSQKLMRSPRYPLMFDESTDISVHQNLIVYIRLLECDMSSTVTTNTFYLSITDLHMANADAIYSKILLICLRKGLIFQICVVFVLMVLQWWLVQRVVLSLALSSQCLVFSLPTAWLIVWLLVVVVVLIPFLTLSSFRKSSTLSSSTFITLPRICLPFLLSSLYSILVLLGSKKCSTPDGSALKELSAL